ncbi:16S rRNA (guanine1207-N2)-methyltransferase [Lentibacillus persicus]|uniref:16S rRNA (Guanine1207-N2)-methyltransferase n=1 Tax=Lentibacillus persicus TaxID=640948 RepID=A0A1I2AFX2_9BACI|nr:class I SAM-dependent methyltransferase [Lentibacillus persicus]SFE41730.1 16S rRNA (guanine1207-N2)-methyltransferase [Lentibacillus persicus]
MSDHYFSQSPQSNSSPKIWQYRLRGKNLTFESDDGVFSKNEVDYGTRFLIEHFEEPSISGPFLDFGCGYGPIGIAVAKSFQQRNVVMTDINERAVELARKNAQHNKVENVEFAVSDRLDNVNGHSFAAIMTNPPIRAGKQTVHRMFEESYEVLQEKGLLWVVIQKKQGAPSAMKKLNELFGNVKVVDRSKGYYLLKMMK